MVSKCANLACGARFRYLREGRLFNFELNRLASAGPYLVGEKKSSRNVEHFWLCHQCAATMTLVVGLRGEVEVVTLNRSQFHRAAAS